MQRLVPQPFSPTLLTFKRTLAISTCPAYGNIPRPRTAIPIIPNLQVPVAHSPVVPSKFKRSSRRVGVIGQKVGLINMYDEYGKWHLLTAIRIHDCQVVQVKPEMQTVSRMGYVNIQVGVGTKQLKNATLPEIGHCAKAGLAPKRKLVEFKVTPDAILPPGTPLSALHFLPGQLVDVTSVSKGKGFAGGMKRHGFGGQRASHGVSKSHRGIGSTGACQDPGRVWKGKKMPGRMGANKVTQEKMKLVRIDPVRDIIYIKGSIPGSKGSLVFVRDALRADNPLLAPFPTHVPSEDDPKEDLFVPLATRNFYDPESQTIHPEKELVGEGPEHPSIT